MTVRKHGRKRRLIIIILILEILTLICLCYLLFVPHSPQAMLNRAAKSMDGIECYVETLYASTEMTLSADDVKGLREIDEKVLNVPVEISSVAEVKAMHGDGSGDEGTDGDTHFFSHIKKTIKYIVFDEETEVYREAYTDDTSHVYVLRADGWHKEKQRAPQTVDPNEMLEIAEASLDKASFRPGDGQYRVIYNAADLDTSILIPFVRNTDDISMISGEVIFGFNKRTKCLETIEGDNIVICSNSAIGTERQEESSSTIDVKIGFRDYGKVDAELLKIPEEVIKDAKTDKDNDDTRKYIFSIEDLEERGEKSFSVGDGEDIPEGHYLVRRQSGAGIVKGLLGENGKESFTYSAGYDYYRIDNMESGKEVKLNEGDKILLSGDGFVVVFEPVED